MAEGGFDALGVFVYFGELVARHAPDERTSLASEGELVYLAGLHHHHEVYRVLTEERNVPIEALVNLPQLAGIVATYAEEPQKYVCWFLYDLASEEESKLGEATFAGLRRLYPEIVEVPPPSWPA